MTDFSFKNKSSDLKSLSRSTCLTFLGLSQIKAFITTFILVASLNSLAQPRCENLFTQSASNKPEVKDLTTLGKAMTEGLILNENQADIFEVYRKVFFGDPNTSVGGYNLKSVTNTLKKHPELEKPHFQEMNISAVEKIYQSPPELNQYVKSQIATAGQICAVFS